MVTTTPGLGIPYAEDSDARGAGAQAQKNMALHLEGLLSPASMFIERAAVSVAVPVGSSVSVPFPGAQSQVAGFSYDATGQVLTYTGPGTVLALLAVEVRVLVTGATTGMSSSVDVFQNSAAVVGGSHSEAAVTPAATMDAHALTHTVTVPVRLSAGDYLEVYAAASGGSSREVLATGLRVVQVARV